MARSVRSPVRNAFAAVQILLLAAALLGLRSPVEILLGAVVLLLVVLNPGLTAPRGRQGVAAGK